MKEAWRQGHSINCVGARGNGLKEEVLASEVLEEVRKLYKARGIDILDCTSTKYNVVDDCMYGVSLANKYKCSVFRSIHFNAFKDKEANGVEVVLYEKGQKIEREVISILKAFEKLGFKNRGIKYNPSLIDLNSTSMPSMVLELGFLTNKEDSDLIKKLGPKKIAETLVNAILGEIKKPSKYWVETLYLKADRGNKTTTEELERVANCFTKFGVGYYLDVEKNRLKLNGKSSSKEVADKIAEELKKIKMYKKIYKL